MVKALHSNASTLDLPIYQPNCSYKYNINYQNQEPDEEIATTINCKARQGIITKVEPFL